MRTEDWRFSQSCKGAQILWHLRLTLTLRTRWIQALLETIVCTFGINDHCTPANQQIETTFDKYTTSRTSLSVITHDNELRYKLHSITDIIFKKRKSDVDNDSFTRGGNKTDVIDASVKYLVNTEHLVCKFCLIWKFAKNEWYSCNIKALVSLDLWPWHKLNTGRPGQHHVKFADDPVIFECLQTDKQHMPGHYNKYKW